MKLDYALLPRSDLIRVSIACKKYYVNTISYMSCVCSRRAVGMLLLLLRFGIMFLYEFKEKKENNICVCRYFCGRYDFCNAWFFITPSFIYLIDCFKKHAHQL